MRGDAQPGGGTPGSSGMGGSSSGDDSSSSPLSYCGFYSGRRHTLRATHGRRAPSRGAPSRGAPSRGAPGRGAPGRESGYRTNSGTPTPNWTPEPVFETETRPTPVAEPDDTDDSSADVIDLSADVGDVTTPQASTSSEQPPAEVLESVTEQTPTELSEALEPAASREAVSTESRGATDYEVSLAGRLLHSEFGVRMGQLSSHLDGQLPGDGPHTVLLLGLDDDPQQTDVIAGLGMFVCGKRNDTTLLVDADTERRAMSQNFQKTGLGVLESMNGTAGWQDSVQQTSCEKLSLLPCGSEHSALERSESRSGTVGRYDQRSMEARVWN